MERTCYVTGPGGAGGASGAVGWSVCRFHRHGDSLYYCDRFYL